MNIAVGIKENKNNVIVDESSLNVFDLITLGRIGELRPALNSPQTQDELRELRDTILWRRLSDHVDALITPPHWTPNPDRDEQTQLQRHSLRWMLRKMIGVSGLDELDVHLSADHRFSGELEAREPGMQSFTSLALFVEDLERMLRVLYGEYDNKMIERVRWALFHIAKEFLHHTRKDLWEEDQHAAHLDWGHGIGVPDGCGISSSEWRRSLHAEGELAVRAFAVKANPDAFSKYTVEFVRLLEENYRLRTNAEISAQLESCSMTSIEEELEAFRRLAKEVGPS